MENKKAYAKEQKKVFDAQKIRSRTQGLDAHSPWDCVHDIAAHKTDFLLRYKYYPCRDMKFLSFFVMFC